MTKQLQRQFVVDNLPSLKHQANHLAARLKGGEILELVGDLGSGKTTFSRYLALALGYSEPVTSPSFSLENIYQAPRFVIHHFDFFRLQKIDWLGLELASLIGDQNRIIIIEWGQLVADYLPPKRLVIQFSYLADATSRQLNYQLPASLAYLIN